MRYLFRRGSTWYAAFTDASGTLHRVTTKTTDREVAQRFLDKKVALAVAR